ncbi:MAG: TonB-dependent receptor [Planctomycetota bacterium]
MVRIRRQRSAGAQWLIASCVLAVCSGLRAQQVGSVRGVVTDRDFDLPLAGAEVTVVETGDKATSGDQGNWSFPQLAPGKYTLAFAKEGYVRAIKSDVVVAAGRLTEVDVALSGDFTEMEEYIVEDVLQLGGSTEGDLLQMRFDSPAMMDAVGADLMSKAGASDAGQALRLVAGASVQNGKSAVIRGLPDRYVSSQMNGVRLPTADEDKRAVELDQFPSEVIESIRVSKTFTPDQQGDASGGAVDVVLKGVPKESFFRWQVQGKGNSQTTGRSGFLSYDDGGLSWDGHAGGDRDIQYDRLGENWRGAAGVSESGAPTDYKLSSAAGGSFEIADGVRFGGLLSVYYDRSSRLVKNAKDDKYWVETPGGPVTPKWNGDQGGGTFETELFDVTRGTQGVKWGMLATAGLETDHHSLNFVYLRTQNAEDKATLAEDTRGKQYHFPGYDPENSGSNGFFEFGAAPYLRFETLAYRERSTETMQLTGRHEFAPKREFAPELEWTIAHSTARSEEPDKRQFASLWTPGFEIPGLVIPAAYVPYKPAASFTLGNFQRIWKTIEETSDQGTIALKLPFRLWDEEGYLKVGGFHDQVDRKFDQETFSNFSDNTSGYGPWEVSWSVNFPFEDHPITESKYDVDYHGRQRIGAEYFMLDVPLLPQFHAVGGVRWEATDISIQNQAEELATWFPPGSLTQTALLPGEADVAYHKDDALPALGFVWRPHDSLTLRAAYSETIARQTFKELTPILQQEYLGGPVFIGNPALERSQLTNYDLRGDWTPYQGGLFSASWFRKDIKGPIEYVQRIATFDFTTPVNYPEGELNGVELETRHALGHFVNALEGLEIGANATFLHSRVQLSDEEITEFSGPSIEAPMESREMTGAPAHLYNAFLTYDIALTGTQLGLFYTVQGDTLVAGAGESDGHLVPSVFLAEHDRLNLTISQRIGETMKLVFQAKNLTDPALQTVYRSQYIGPDITKTSFHEGVDLSLSIGGEIHF